MWHLMPLVIAILLGGMISASSIYYGGDMFWEGADGASANTFVNEASQVRSASQLYRIENGSWPDEVSDLVGDGQYMTGYPTKEYTLEEGGQIVSRSDELTESVCDRIQQLTLGDDQAGCASDASIEQDQAFGAYEDGGGYVFFHN